MHFVMIPTNTSDRHMADEFANHVTRVAAINDVAKTDEVIWLIKTNRINRLEVLAQVAVDVAEHRILHLDNVLDIENDKSVFCTSFVPPTSENFGPGGSELLPVRVINKRPPVASESTILR